jgi:ATP-dependent DNA helicase RecG
VSRQVGRPKNRSCIEYEECIRVILEGNEAPYLCDGRAYIRVADESLLMSSKELGDFFAKHRGVVSKWDSEISDIEFEDMDKTLVEEYVKRANKAGRIGWEFSNVSEASGKLGLLKDGKPRNAAKVMFSTKPDLIIQMARFATDKRLTFTDIRQEQGTIIELIDKAERYIVDAMNWRAEITGTLQRKEIPEVPLTAIREALLNSYCRRLFSDSQYNEVAVYKNRIEIYNPGTFPEGLTPEDFINEAEPPVHRNPFLAQIMYYSKEIEHFGTGLGRIHNECSEAGVAYEFKPTKRGFKVVFFRREDDKNAFSAENFDDDATSMSDEAGRKQAGSGGVPEVLPDTSGYFRKPC